MMNLNQRPRWQQILIAAAKAGAYLALFLGSQLVVSMVYSTLISMRMMLEDPNGFDFQRYADAVLARSMEISLVSNLLTLLILLIVFKVRRKKLRNELWLEPASGLVFGWAAGLAFCLYWTVTLVMTYLPESWMNDYAEASSVLDQTGLLTVLSTAIIGPIAEEVIFRGLIFTRLRRVLPGQWAIVISAAVFGMCHGNFVWFLYAFSLGLLFAWVTERTGSVLPGTVMHIVFNSTNELAVLLGDETSIVFFVFILAFGTAGTVFCALQLRNAVPPRKTRAEGFFETGGRTVTVQGSAPESHPAAPELTVQLEKPARPGQACWDEDSGPNHRFPPNKL